MFRRWYAWAIHGLETWFQHRITNAVAEGFNGVIQSLKNAARGAGLSSEENQLKSRIMKRVLVNDAEIRNLAEPWLDDLDQMLAGKPKILH